MKREIDRENPWVCHECGAEYMKEQGMDVSDSVITCHQDQCKVCGQIKTVTHERHYRWLSKWQE